MLVNRERTIKDIDPHGPEYMRPVSRGSVSTRVWVPELCNKIR